MASTTPQSAMTPQPSTTPLSTLPKESGPSTGDPPTEPTRNLPIVFALKPVSVSCHTCAKPVTTTPKFVPGLITYSTCVGTALTG